jgi:hypothetical protein
VIYYPFFKIYDRKLYKEQMEGEAQGQNDWWVVSQGDPAKWFFARHSDCISYK